MIQRFGTKCCGQMKSGALASTVFGGKEILSMTQRTTSPPSSMEVEPLCSGAVFLLRGQDGFTVPCTVKYENFQNSKNSEAWVSSLTMTRVKVERQYVEGLKLWGAEQQPISPKDLVSVETSGPKPVCICARTSLLQRMVLITGLTLCSCSFSSWQQ